MLLAKPFRKQRTELVSGQEPENMAAVREGSRVKYFHIKPTCPVSAQ